ncbi:glucose-1-phosphate thymidylyltransferase RfbA [Planktomarina temperata]|nr:glucose-1-phosphate thymidylyltransferase RfbA [Planktomarina temperata]
MKGIILAGGKGSRMAPLTRAISKHLLPVHDKPMIYYPLGVLLLAGIRDILIISTPDQLSGYQALLNDGSQLGISIKYEVQHHANGIAEAFIIGEKFIDNSPVALILGDNFFYVEGFEQLLKQLTKLSKGAFVIAKRVKNPSDYGVVEFNSDNKVVSIEEKPLSPKSNFALTGLYFYDSRVVDFAKKLTPSNRNELEITDINNIYLNDSELNVKLLGRGAQWFDMGTLATYRQANALVAAIENSKDFKVGCIEEIAYNLGYITKSELERLSAEFSDNEYREYLCSILNHQI